MCVVHLFAREITAQPGIWSRSRSRPRDAPTSRSRLFRPTSRAKDVIFDQIMQATFLSQIVTIYVLHYLPTVILRSILIGIPSPTHSFILGLIPSFSANPSHRSLSFSFFRFHYIFTQTVYCLLLAYPYLLFNFFYFILFSFVVSVR